MNTRSTFSPLTWILSAAALVIGLWIFIPMLKQARSGASDASPAIGKTLQELHLVPINKAAAPTELKTTRDHVVFINFWGTWCHFCNLEMPHLVETYRELRKDRGLMFMTVSCDDSMDLPELQSDTEEYLRRNKFSDLPAYSDPTGQTRAHIAALAGFGSSFGYPTTVIIDKKGIVRGVWVGVGDGGPEATVKEQRDMLAELLR